MSAPQAIGVECQVSISIAVHKARSQELEKQVKALDQFFDFKNSKKPGTEAEKILWKQAIDDSYKAIVEELLQSPDDKRTLVHLLTKVLTQHAHLVYGGDMNLTRLCFLGCLSLQLEEILDNQFCVLDRVKVEPALDGFIQYLKSNPAGMDQLQEQLETALSHQNVILKCRDEQMLFDLTANLDWLGRCCQNLSQYQKNQALLSKLYGEAQEIYRHLIEVGSPGISKEASWQIADNLYNTGMHMHYLAFPDDHFKALNSLLRMKPYLDAEGGSLRAVTKAAQVENKTALHLWNIKGHIPTEQHSMIDQLVFNKVKQALAIAEQKKDEGFDRFLLSMFYNNVASFGVETALMTPGEAEAYSNEAIRLAEEQGLDHFYFVNYFIQAAKIAKALGNGRVDEYHAKVVELKAKFDR